VGRTAGRQRHARSSSGVRAQPGLWDDVPRTANDPLSLGVKRAFDPLGILNPGIL
jgi:FAD/FMN-containing dehydrogenase